MPTFLMTVDTLLILGSCFRTFLTTVEIVIICVFTVLFVIFLALLTIYVCMYGWVIPACCRSAMITFKS